MQTILPFSEIEEARKKLYQRYKKKFVVDLNFNRKIVSFQGNKEEPFFRWFKYKEGFSTHLVKYFFQKYQSENSQKRYRVLDPFAGIGTTLLTGTREGWGSTGVFLLSESRQRSSCRRTFKIKRNSCLSRNEAHGKIS